MYFLIVTEESPKPFPLSVLWNFQYILNNFFSVLLFVLPLFLGSRHVSLGWVPKADSPGVQEEGGACVQRAGARCQWAGQTLPQAQPRPSLGTRKAFSLTSRPCVHAVFPLRMFFLFSASGTRLSCPTFAFSLVAFISFHQVL